MTSKKLTIIVLDIETNGLNGFKADLAYLLCVGFKELNSKKIHCVGLDDFRSFAKRPYDDRELVLTLYKILKEVDVIIGHYASRFDWPFIKSRFEYYKLKPLKYIEVIDTWLMCRNNFKFTSNRLANLANILSLKNKKMSKGNDWSIWWKRAAAGDLAAIKFIKTYCKQDINTTEDLAVRLRDFWPQSVLSRAFKNQIQTWPKRVVKQLKNKIDPVILERLQGRISIPKTHVDTACWVWTGSTGSHGYGDIRLPKNKLVLAHRYMFELFKHPISKGKNIDHLCYNRKCVNPSHLEEVSPKENIHRAIKNGSFDAYWQSLKGKIPAANNHNNIYACKLTYEDALYIRDRYHVHKERMVNLALQFKVSIGTIKNIISKRSYDQKKFAKLMGKIG